MFHNNKMRRIFATIIAVLLVLAMIVPLALSAIGIF